MPAYLPHTVLCSDSHLRYLVQMGRHGVTDNHAPAYVTPIVFAFSRGTSRRGRRSIFVSPYKFACRLIRQASTTLPVERSYSARDSTVRAADPQLGTPMFLYRHFRRRRRRRRRRIKRKCSRWGSILGYRFWMSDWRCMSTI